MQLANWLGRSIAFIPISYREFQKSWKILEISAIAQSATCRHWLKFSRQVGILVAQFATYSPNWQPCSEILPTCPLLRGIDFPLPGREPWEWHRPQTQESSVPLFLWALHATRFGLCVRFQNAFAEDLSDLLHKEEGAPPPRQDGSFRGKGGGEPAKKPNITYILPYLPLNKYK